MPPLHQLTFTRFAAALLVLVFHFGLDTPPFNAGLLGRIVANGNVGVSYFFVLSGFIMAYVYHTPDALDAQTPFQTGRFFLNRFSRIYPLYIFALLMFLGMARIWKTSLPPVDLFLNLTLLQAWVPGKELTMNFPGWSLSVECFFYLVFPFLLLFFGRRTSKAVLWYTVLFWAVCQALHLFFSYGELIPWQANYHNPLLHSGTFVFGCGAGILFVRHKARFQHTLGIGWASVCLLAVLCLLAINGLPYHNGLYAPLFMAGILGLSTDKGPVARFLSLRPLVFLGEISYGFYILQFPCKLVLDRWGFQFLPYFGRYRFFYLLVFLLLLSSLLYLILEKPLKTFIRNKIQTKNSVAKPV